MREGRIIALIEPDDPIYYDDIEDDEPYFGRKCRRLDPNFVVFSTEHQRVCFLWIEEDSEPCSDEEEVKE